MKWPSWAHLRPDPTDDVGYDYRGRTQCAECGKVVLQSEALVVVKHTGRSTMQEHFCSEQCANDWYLERLRSSGL